MEEPSRTHQGSPVDGVPSALDAPARRGLARARRRGWAMVVAAILLATPAVVIVVRYARLQISGERVSAHVVSRQQGVLLDRMVVTWDQGRRTSVIHVDDAMVYCGPGRDEFLCREPLVIVDPDAPGHATIKGVLNVSLAAQIVASGTLYLGIWVALILICLGIAELVTTARRRRHLARATWQRAWLQVHGSRARALRRGATCSVALVTHPDEWCPANVRGPAKHLHALVDEEQIEIAVSEADDRILVRTPDGEELIDATLHMADAAPLQRALVRAGIAPGRDGETAPSDGSVLVLVGNDGDYDIFDANGVAAGEVTGKFHGTLRTSTFEIVDRDGALTTKMTKRGGRWRVIAPDGQVLTQAKRSSSGKRFTFAPAHAADGGATQAVRERALLQPTRDTAAGKGPTSEWAMRWTLSDGRGEAVAQVTFAGPAKVIEVLADGTSPSRRALVSQCLVIAIGGVIPSSGG